MLTTEEREGFATQALYKAIKDAVEVLRYEKRLTEERNRDIQDEAKFRAGAQAYQQEETEFKRPPIPPRSPRKTTSDVTISQWSSLLRAQSSDLIKKSFALDDKIMSKVNSFQHEFTSIDNGEKEIRGAMVEGWICMSRVKSLQCFQN